ncbi:MAG: thermonuclease family protein [Cyanobacteria bacterium P01_E01_bin.42]
MTRWQKFYWGWTIFALCFKVASLLSSMGGDRNDLALYEETQTPVKEPIAIELCSVEKQAIADGDTMRVTCDDRELTIHLCGIDAPEIGQPLGIEARDYLRSLLPEEETIIVLAFDRDAQGDFIVQAIASDAKFVHEEMVRSGMAWHDEEVSEVCSIGSLLESAARSAKEKKLGVYANPNTMTLWEWRESDESKTQ